MRRWPTLTVIGAWWVANMCGSWALVFSHPAKWAVVIGCNMAFTATLLAMIVGAAVWATTEG